MFDIVQWKEFENLIRKYFVKDYRMRQGPDAFYDEGDVWIRTEEYENSSDEEILQCLENQRKFEGDLYVINEDSRFKNIGAFKIKAENLYEDIEICTSFCLVNTDLMIFNFELRVAWIFMHEGFYIVKDYSNRNIDLI